MENGKGEWRSFVPAPIGIPAVAYSFAQQISERLDCPVGMVVAAMGDTPIEAWMRLQSLESDPSYEPVLKRYQKVESELKEKLPEWEAKMAEWEVINDKYKKEGQYADAKAIKDWEASKAEAEKSGEEIPPRPKPTWTARPQFPNGGAHTPTILYNGMVHPFIPFAMRGMIFYQGESNAKDPETYGKLFPLFIRDYRSMWGQGDFPFLFVQLANFEDPKRMAVAIDLGDPKDIHPLNKWDVGHRLALLARKLAYKEAIVASGPSFAGLLAEDNRLRIRFENVGTGLAIGAPPHPIPNHPPLPTDRLVGFEIAGADGQWLAADAKMEGADVVISHADVPQPTQVRYAWADSPSCNLYNQEGLPAVPFRAALSESGKPTVR
jgi:sialate O-acetylesterase